MSGSPLQVNPQDDSRRPGGNARITGLLEAEQRIEGAVRSRLSRVEAKSNDAILKAVGVERVLRSVKS